MPGQSGPGSNANEEVLRIPQSPSIARTSPSDCLVSYPGHSLGGGLTPLQRCSQCILQPQPTGQYTTWGAQPMKEYSTLPWSSEHDHETKFTFIPRIFLLVGVMSKPSKKDTVSLSQVQLTGPSIDEYYPIYQPLRSARLWHKVNFNRSLTGFNSEFSFS